MKTRFTWVCRNSLRVQSHLPPDGLFNANLPCGVTIVGVEESEKVVFEILHLSSCTKCWEEAGGQEADRKGLQVFVDAFSPLAALDKTMLEDIVAVASEHLEKVLP